MSIQKFPVFVDGQYGTTGLEISTLLKKHPRIELLKIKQTRQKYLQEKLSLYKKAALVILCLPDEEAKTVVDFIDQEKLKVKILDASTAHRTHPAWVYGFPELIYNYYQDKSKSKKYRTLIQQADRVTNPGCYATAFISLVKPLVDHQIIAMNSSNDLHVYGVSGYSGGGKKLIHFFSTQQKLDINFLPYGLDLNHKHLPEMILHTGLKKAPLFQVAVANFYRGLIVSTFISKENLTSKIKSKKLNLKKTLLEIYHQYYEGETYVKINSHDKEELLNGKYLHSLAQTKHSNALHIVLGGGENHSGDGIVLHASLDNLGKGAATQAIQNLNLMLGSPEEIGLEKI